MSHPIPATGTWCHIEIPSTDPDRAKAFYSELFGWTFQDMPMPEGTYTVYMTREGAVGGGIWNPPEGMPRQTVNYVAVDDLAASVAGVKANGGQVYLERQDVPGMGSFSIVADPDGNCFGLWQGAPQE